MAAGLGRWARGDGERGGGALRVWRTLNSKHRGRRVWRAGVRRSVIGPVRGSGSRRLLQGDRQVRARTKNTPGRARSSVIVCGLWQRRARGGCVDLPHCGDGRLRHPQQRANSIARGCSRRVENDGDSRTISHCLRGPYLDGLPASGREREQPGHRSARAARRIRPTNRALSLSACCSSPRHAAQHHGAHRRHAVCTRINDSPH